MKYDVRQLKLLSNEEIACGIFDMRLSLDGEQPEISCGQFAHVYVPGKSLRRPISVCDASNGVLRLVYQIKGEGTMLMSKMKPGQDVDVLYPLGHGFDIKEGKRYCLIGGGIGVPPMLYTAKQCTNPLVITGFRNKDLVILQDDFRAANAELTLCTDDGTAGQKGFVTDMLKEKLNEIDEVCACGPTPMLKAIAEVCGQAGKPCQISLEERMGCGVGACLVCAVKVRKAGEEIMQHVCKNGPVFNAEEVVF
ncbi:MAG TPA: dihydroorotate dehydrogenase electron transfer subunit [Ruminococcaceae bacterium]|nr:dihydroorotate dehydrogenase electron transfer subunit [Oscillospiraceae bacterium]